MAADISATDSPSQQWRCLLRMTAPLIVTVMSAKKRNKQAIMRPADIEAAHRLRAIWDAKAKDLKLTQLSAGEKLDINQSAVSQYLNAKIPLGVTITIRWAKILHCEVTDIRPEYADLIEPLSTSSQPTGAGSYYRLPDGRLMRSPAELGDSTGDTASQSTGLDQSILSDALQVIDGAAQWEGVQRYRPSAREIAIAYALLEDSKERVGSANMIGLVKAFLQRRSQEQEDEDELARGTNPRTY